MRVRWTVAAAALGVVLVGGARRTDASTIATLVDLANIPPGLVGSGAQYDLASVSLVLDPALTSWVAWNNLTTVALASASCSAFTGGSGVCLGPGGFGTDDFIALTVTNPLSASLTLNLDQNDALGNSFGTQNVIFGTAAAAPDAYRVLSPFSTPTSVFLNEAGAFNALFTTAGTYTFSFSFRNNFGGADHAGHQDIYLLREVASPVTPPAAVPEPATLLLLGSGLTAFARRQRPPTVA